MKNKSFIGIDISKNVIDASIFCEGTPIKDFPHAVFNNSHKGFGEMCTWLVSVRILGHYEFGTLKNS
jgi:transposase